MIFRMCECGRAQRWDSGEIVHPCQGCDTCLTTYVTSPTGHAPLAPHDWRPLYDQLTGEQTNVRRCAVCSKTQRVHP